MTTPRQTVTVTHVIAYDEALTAEIAALEAKAAANPGKQRMSAKDDAADRLADIRKRLAGNAVRITFEALPWRAYAALRADHKKRPDVEADERAGYNTDTFADALLQAAIVSTTDLDGQPVPNEWDTWADEMTDGQWYDAFRATLRLQTSGNPVYPR